MQIYMTHIWIRNALLYAGFFTAIKKEPDYMSYLVLIGVIILTFILANKYIERLFNFTMKLSLKFIQKAIK